MFSVLARSLVLTFLLAVTVSLAYGETSGPAVQARENKIRVLIVTGGHRFDRANFFEIFNGHPDIEWKEVAHPEAVAWFAPDKADQYDVMVWYDSIREVAKLTPEGQKNLLQLLQAGKPLVALHHCIADYLDWPEAEKIIGGKYLLKPEGDDPASTFKHNVEFEVKIADKTHPITRGMNDFEIKDEVYGKLRVQPNVKPLLTVHHPKSYPLVGWTHTYGRSPVAYIQLGHDRFAYQNPSYRRVVVQAIRWAAGRLPDPSEEGFVPLFNGKDLEGWESMSDPNLFVVKDGVLRSDLPIGDGDEWIRTKKMFGDFILRLEWRVSQGGNSGVFLRSQDKSRGYPWETGSEVQITNSPSDASHCTGALYGIVPVDSRPDESADVWHELEIECRGPDYRVFADGVPVVDVDARQVPGLREKPFIGYIGLQGNHSEDGWIEYRNLRIKELPMAAGSLDNWRLGVQAWTFHHVTLFEAIDRAQALGLKYIEAYPGQPLSPDDRGLKFDEHLPVEAMNKAKRKLIDTGVALVNFGVVKITPNEAKTRKLFEFARLMGIETIVAEPDLKAFDLLDQLTQEYGINVAIHNHPKKPFDPGYVYWSPDEVRRLIEGRHKRIGVCADTGHWARSGLEPLACLKKLEGRIISLHLKDLNTMAPDGHDVPWGTGVCDVKAMLTELDRQGFAGMFSIEYEWNWEKSMPDIAQCIAFFQAVERELNR